MTSIAYFGFGALVNNAASGFLAVTMDGYALDDSNDAIAFGFVVPKTGSVTKIGFCVTALVGSPQYWVDLQGSTDMNPDGSSFGGSARAAFNPAGTGWAEVTLATPASVTAGDVVQAHIYPNTATVTPSASDYASVADEKLGASVGYSVSYFTSGWLGDDVGIPSAYIEYSDGTVAGVKSDSATFAKGIDVNTTPDEYGAKFVAPFSMDVYGLYFGLAKHQPADYTISLRLYDSGDNVLMSQLFDEKEEYTSDIQFTRSSPVTLVAGQTYRVALAYTGGSTSDELAYFLSFASQSDRNQSPFGAPDTWQVTHRANGGAWTDEAVTYGTVVGLLTEFRWADMGIVSNQFSGYVS